MNTRIALLDSAERVARQRGYDGFSYADLSREVGIRKASIHYHFPAKADLAYSLIERYAARFLNALNEIDDASPKAADKLRAYLSLYRDALAGGSQVCLCVALNAGRDSLAPPVLDQLNRFHEDSIAWLTGVYSTAVKDGSVFGVSDPAAEAQATLALMEGAQLIARAANDQIPFDQATAAFSARLSAPKIQ